MDKSDFTTGPQLQSYHNAPPSTSYYNKLPEGPRCNQIHDGARPPSQASDVLKLLCVFIGLPLLVAGSAYDINLRMAEAKKQAAINLAKACKAIEQEKKHDDVRPGAGSH